MTSASLSRQKSAMRKLLLRLRNSLSEDDKNTYNQMIAEHLLSHFKVCTSATIAGYLSFGGEPDITAAMRRLYASGHRIAVPCVDPDITGEMQFHDWSPDMPLRANRYAIPEPAIAADQAPVQHAEFDALLIPVVGFDVSGRRLGMGGGYYDRWLAAADPKRPERIGIAYGWQQQTRIPFDTMDQPLHRVITEQGIIDCHSHSTQHDQTT